MEWNARSVSSHWPVGEVRTIRALGGGSINAAFRVETSSVQYHLRVYRSPDRTRAEREHAAIAVAAARGVPTPKPLRTHERQTLVGLGSQWAALFPVAPGQPVPRPVLTPGHAGELGRFLAELHARLPENVPFDVQGMTLAPVSMTLDRLKAIEQAILALPAPDEVDGWALERTRQRLSHLQTSPLPDELPDLPLRFLHGDYHDGNVFFVEGRAGAIIDWEQPRRAPRTWEIVRALHLSLHLRPELAGPFLHAYRERLSLPADELEAGAEYYGLLQERNVWTFQSVYLDGNPGPRAFIRPPPYRPFPLDWKESGLR